MQRLLVVLSIVLTAGCGGCDTPTSLRAVPDSVLTSRLGSMARIATVNDSAVMVALAREGTRLEYRWVVDASAPDDEVRMRVVDPQSGKRLTLDDTLVLDLSRVQSVVSSHLPDPEHSAVILHLDMVNADRLVTNTNRHLGRQLVITLNGQVLAAPIIQTPFGSSILVAPDLDSGVAVQLAARLRAALPASKPPQ